MRAAALVAVVGVVAVVVVALLAGLGLQGPAQPDPNQAGTATVTADATADATAGAAVSRLTRCPLFCRWRSAPRIEAGPHRC